MKTIIYRRKSHEDKDRQVLSLESQHRAIERLREQHPELDIVDDLGESRSAATPGRPVFDEMLDRIEKGEADAIMAWAPDRLSRNSVDAGRIIHMLDTGRLKGLYFCTYTFENNPTGKFMLQMMLVQSKYFSDALSVNVKLGIRTKLENGWRPGHLPLGYKNDKETKTIVRHPEHFVLVQRMFAMALAGTHSPREIHVIARDQWGLHTRLSQRSGGKPLCLSAIYKILKNPFYAGLNPWNGTLYSGKHEAMVPLDEFNAVQALIARPGKAKPQAHGFAYIATLAARARARAYAPGI